MMSSNQTQTAGRPTNLFPIGNYCARATGAIFDTSSVKGTPYVRVSLRVTEGPLTGRTISWDGYMSEKTRTRTTQSLIHCGCRFEKRLPNGQRDFQDVTGIDRNEVEIVVEHESYTDKQGQPKTRARVQWINSRQGRVAKRPMDASQKAAMSDLMANEIEAALSGMALPPVAPMAPMAEEQEDDADQDSIPF